MLPTTAREDDRQALRKEQLWQTPIAQKKTQAASEASTRALTSFRREATRSSRSDATSEVISTEKASPSARNRSPQLEAIDIPNCGLPSPIY